MAAVRALNFSSSIGRVRPNPSIERHAPARRGMPLMSNVERPLSPVTTGCSWLNSAPHNWLEPLQFRLTRAGGAQCPVCSGSDSAALPWQWGGDIDKIENQYH